MHLEDVLSLNLMSILIKSRLDPGYASVHNNLGIMLEDNALAETHFREALRLQPSHQSAHVNMGNLLL